ncbi:hypothetical protein RHGRI_038659 [Rhododendron griersonianum]|uniref:Uncharacterized protein n=1 Tax=Rhododendron griersonianum TaxID=479676 RepID=A0AAV6HJE9_9ERIC|nr:hypothetical protein RHGRI_038659 [Rhododendron griersonianum]
MIPATRSIPSLELLEDGGVVLQQGQLDHPSMDPSSNGQNVVTAERNILMASSSKEGKRKMQDREHKKAGVKIEVSLDKILKCSNMKLNFAARELKGLSGGQHTLSEGEPSIVPIMHTRGGAHFLNYEFVFKRLTEQNDWPIKYPENTPIQDNGYGITFSFMFDASLRQRKTTGILDAVFCTPSSLGAKKVADRP